jgi:hypothetical protein
MQPLFWDALQAMDFGDFILHPKDRKMIGTI